MPVFICLGERWVNVDKIIDVRTEIDHKDQLTCYVHCGQKDYLTFTGDEAKALLEFVKKHKLKG